jgi:hypothetical protein
MMAESRYLVKVDIDTHERLLEASPAWLRTISELTDQAFKKGQNARRKAQ